MLVPVIMSGGSGTRLWPLSRKSKPKQFVELFDGKPSFFRQTLERLKNLKIDSTGWVIITSEEHRSISLKQATEAGVNIEKIFLEPVQRNTAAAVAVAAIQAIQINKDAKLLIQTADHIIDDLDYFSTIIEEAYNSDKEIVVFGVDPTYPETGYGYIKYEQSENGDVYFSDFIEKPSYHTAAEFLKKGTYLWNSGMFLLDAKAILARLEKFEPKVLKFAQKAIELAEQEMVFSKLNETMFSQCPSISIDKAVMERSQDLAVMKYQSGWSDVGSWKSVYELSQKDKNGNAVNGTAVLKNVSNSFVRSDKRIVTLMDVDNLCVVDTGDALLICDLSNTQNVKSVSELSGYPDKLK